MLFERKCVLNLSKRMNGKSWKVFLLLFPSLLLYELLNNLEQRAIWLYLSEQFKIAKRDLQIRGPAMGIVYIIPERLMEGGEIQLS
jgi:hypothetical protein